MSFKSSRFFPWNLCAEEARSFVLQSNLYSGLCWLLVVWFNTCFCLRSFVNWLPRREAGSDTCRVESVGMTASSMAVWVSMRKYIIAGCISFPLCQQVLKLHAASAKSLQLCPTLCDPIDSSPPGSAVPGILQARMLEWVAISFSNAWKWKVKVKSLSCVLLFATPWTAAYQAPLSMGFSKQEYWSGLPLPSP